MAWGTREQSDRKRRGRNKIAAVTGRMEPLVCCLWWVVDVEFLGRELGAISGGGGGILLC